MKPDLFSVKARLPVTRWEVVDDETGKVHQVVTTEDGQWAKCNCERAKRGETCGAMEAVAVHLEAEQNPPRIH